MSKSKSVPPAETAGTEITRFNALRHGVLSCYDAPCSRPAWVEAQRCL
jgi:hypothetical protein